MRELDYDFCHVDFSLCDPAAMVVAISDYIVEEYVANLRLEMQQAGNVSLDTSNPLWYKKQVEPKHSAKRYRVINQSKEPLMSDQPTGAAAGATAEDATNPGGQPTPENQPGKFSKLVDWIALKVKTNRGALGIVAGAALTIATQHGIEKYRDMKAERTEGNSTGGADTTM